MSSELKKASTGLTFIGGILVFLIFGILVVVFWPRTKAETLDEQRARAREIKLELLEKDNHARLSIYAWVNKDKGIVQLPIDRAMQLVSAELAAKPVRASAVKVENPYPYGLQSFSYAPAPAAPAASGTAAPAASGSAAPAASGSAAPVASGSAAPVASGSAAPVASGSAVPAASGTTAPAPPK